MDYVVLGTFLAGGFICSGLGAYNIINNNTITKKSLNLIGIGLGSTAAFTGYIVYKGVKEDKNTINLIEDEGENEGGLEEDIKK